MLVLRRVVVPLLRGMVMVLTLLLGQLSLGRIVVVGGLRLVVGLMSGHGGRMLLSLWRNAPRKSLLCVCVTPGLLGSLTGMSRVLMRSRSDLIGGASMSASLR